MGCPYRKFHPASHSLSFRQLRGILREQQLGPFLTPDAGATMCIFASLFLFVRGLVSDRARLATENLALRQQLAVLNRAMPRPKIRRGDRVF